MSKLRIRPLSGKIIRDPSDGRVLPADRDTVVSATSYWLRRLRDKDIEIVEKSVVKKVEPVKSEKKSKKVDDKKDDNFEL